MISGSSIWEVMSPSLPATATPSARNIKTVNMKLSVVQNRLGTQQGKGNID